jgi:TerC family integral membrane protein
MGTDMSEVLLWHWVGFGVLVAVLLALDLLVFHRHAHAPSLRESAGWSIFWISLALAFNGLLWWWDGPDTGTKFLTAYVIEKALSMDNIFVFVVIFRFFSVPLMYQYRVLFWGILGAIIMRLVFILAGIELIHRFDWVIPLFGLFLVYTGYKLARHSGVEVHPEQNLALKVARRLLPVTGGDHRHHGHRFFAWENGRWLATPMFLALLVIESTDVVFAVDSGDRDYQRPVPRLQFQHLRYPGPAGAVLPLGRHGRRVPLPALRIGRGAQLCGREDAGRVLDETPGDRAAADLDFVDSGHGLVGRFHGGVAFGQGARAPGHGGLER